MHSLRTQPESWVSTTATGPSHRRKAGGRLRLWLLSMGLFCPALLGWAQPDYPAARWVPIPEGHWYTSGYAHSFSVIHDMEGYYQSTLSYFQRSDTQVSIHFCVNSLQNGVDSVSHAENNPNDSAPGEVAQMVREENWTWHARCWNRYMFGTEHEGFVNSPIWYSEPMYKASAALQRHLCVSWDIPPDRNHIIGHDEHLNPLWTNWVNATWAGTNRLYTNLPPLDPTCNSHTDPGIYWNWSHFISLITNCEPIITHQPLDLTLQSGSNVSFSVAVFGAAPFAFQWRLNGTNLAGATTSSLEWTNAQLSQAGAYSVLITNGLGSVLSSNAALIFSLGPWIASQPLDRTIAPGQNASFQARAGGDLPLSYQWLFNGSNIDGATQSAWTVSAALEPAVGAYALLVTNWLGSALSSNAHLRLLPLGGWGDNAWGQATIPAVTANAVAIAAGGFHNLALGADGILTAWGDNFDGQCEVPEISDIIAFGAGGYHSLALKLDGSLRAWGNNDYGQCSVPASLHNVLALAGGTWHSLALKSDGSVQAWGDNSSHQCAVPAGLTNATAIAAGGSHSLALRADGSVLAWGENTDSQGAFAGQSVVPPGLSNVIGIAAGDFHSLALKSDGSIVAWGDNSLSQCAVPQGLTGVAAVAAGASHSLALLTNGTLAAWGANGNGQCSLVAGLSNVLAIAAGQSHSLVLVPQQAPSVRLLKPSRSAGRFSLLLRSFATKHYALEYSSSLSNPSWSALSTNAGNGELRLLSDPAPSGSARFYRVRQW